MPSDNIAGNIERTGELRKLVKRLRKEKSYSEDGSYKLTAEFAALSQKLFSFIKNKADIKNILVYYPLKDELPLLSLYERLMIEGYSLFFPVTGEKKMDFFKIEEIKKDSFTPGRMDILEPANKKTPFKGANETAAIVPGLVFSKNTGGRIGYGGGFYDTFLADNPSVLKIGACYEFQLYENLKAGRGEMPQHERDIKMDWILTEKELYGREWNYGK